MKKGLRETVLNRHKKVHNKRYTEELRYRNCMLCYLIIEKKRKNFYKIWKKIEKSFKGLVYTEYSQIVYTKIQSEKEKKIPNKEQIEEQIIELDNLITYQVDKYKLIEERIKIFN